MADKVTAGDIVIIGAGPAGLTAAYELVRRRRRATVIEADDIVGGISRTVERDGYRFDIGGHRFFTKVPEVEAFWHEILPDEDFLLRPRMSRIFYNGAYFDYPLRPLNALRGLGVLEAVRCVASYIWARVRPPKDTTTFEGWVAARFGWRLYRIFFKTYTEKVWGTSATAIQADWAAQRIKSLSLGKAIANSLLPRRRQTEITSLIEEFQYPRLGPGMMWEACRDRVVEAGIEVAMQTTVVEIRRDAHHAVSVVAEGPEGRREFDADHVISSMPLGQLVHALQPPPPLPVLAAAGGLRHRDFLTIALVVPESHAFPDNWIYVHSTEVRMGRIQNFGSWSPHLVKDGSTCLGLEYFVNVGDELWESSDDDLIGMGIRELTTLGITDISSVSAGYVVRMPKAYPVYDVDYAANVDIIRAWLAENVPNVHAVGRNGMHRYNNQDHSMYTAMLAVDTIVSGRPHDVWSVNVEDVYHESDEGGSVGGTGRSAPILS